MDPQQALRVVDTGLQAFVGNRQQHVELQVAFEVVRNIVNTTLESEEQAKLASETINSEDGAPPPAAKAQAESKPK